MGRKATIHSLNHMLLTHDLNSSRNDIDLLVPPCPYLNFLWTVPPPSIAKLHLTHTRPWQDVALCCSSCWQQLHAGRHIWVYELEAWCLPFLPHSLSCIPGRVRVNNSPDTEAAASDTAAASFPSLSRPGLGADRPGNKPKNAHCGTRLPEVPEGFQKFQCRWQMKVPEGSARFRKVPGSSGADARSRLRSCGGSGGFQWFRDVSVQMRAEGSGISGRFRKVPASSGAVARSRFREVPVYVAGQSSGGSGRFREGSVNFGADAYCHVKDELHERASCHRSCDFLGTAPRLPAPESACIGHVGHVFGPCWLQLG